MDKTLFEKSDFLHLVFDTMPLIIFIVDPDVQILHLNSAASDTLSLDIEKVYGKRGGDALHCIHSFDVPEGCGRAEFCKDCVVRNAVNAAFNGDRVYRKVTRMRLKNKDEIAELSLLVTTSPLEYEHNMYALLVLEDVSELIQLRSLLPICMHCKKIRDDKDYWISVEEYFSTHIDIEFSHGLCTECFKKMYPQYDMRNK